MFTKGQQVKLSPKAYPTQRWVGEVLRKTANGFSVKYELNGMWFKQTFHPNEMEA